MPADQLMSLCATALDQGWTVIELKSEIAEARGVPASSARLLIDDREAGDQERLLVIVGDRKLEEMKISFQPIDPDERGATDLTDGEVRNDVKVMEGQIT